MTNPTRLQPLVAAKQFIHKHFPNCHGAVLSGSVVRGNATKTSDLDIVIIDPMIPFAYRESMLFKGWPVEVFAHNITSYKQIFKEDYERAVPTHPILIYEGVTLVNRGGIMDPIKNEAMQVLKNGPEPWSKETIKMKRYFITDALDDFIGSTDHSEDLCIANTLADWIQEFYLRANGQWRGEGKWVIRALKKYDEPFSTEYIRAFDHFYQTREKERVIALVEKVLQPFGGRLFDGFSVGKYW